MSTPPATPEARRWSTGRPAGRGLTQKGRERRAALLFLIPDVLGLLVFLGLPMLLSLVLGFFRVSGFGGYEFIGLANYRRMFSDPLFFNSLLTTLVYIVAIVPGTFVLSLGLALLVKERLPFVGLFRSAFFVPYVISVVVLGLVWQFMLTDAIGVINRALASVGITGLSWLGSPGLALVTVIGVSIWLGLGYYMILFLAGLQDIPREYYESARLDGAGAWASFRHVTWPLLKPTSFFILLTSTIAAFTGGFELIYILTNGGPANATTLTVFYIYQQAFVFGEFGYAAAMGSFVVLILLVCSLGLFALTKGGRFSYE